MSFGDSKIPQEQAKKEAEKHLRLEIGNIPHLGEASVRDDEYVFPILVGIPSVIFENAHKGDPQPVEVQFMSDIEAGEIVVDAHKGSILEATSADAVDDKITQRKQELADEVKRALIKSAADDLSLLPYPIHRQTPVVEILSELLISDKIEERKLLGLEKFQPHIETLIEVGLIEREDQFLVPSDSMKTIKSSGGKISDRLNKAMKFMFERKADDLEFMNGFLGPYLDVAGYYYWRALRSETLPEVSIEEFREVLARSESGIKAETREFQAARYLIQLEQIGLMNVSAHGGERTWVGDQDLKEDILVNGDWSPFGIVSA